MEVGDGDKVGCGDRELEMPAAGFTEWLSLASAKYVRLSLFAQVRNYMLRAKKSRRVWTLYCESSQ